MHKRLARRAPRPVTLLLVGVAILLSTIGLTSAHAADVSTDVVKDITITNLTSQDANTVGDSVQVTIGINSAPNRVAADDTFSIKFPAEIGVPDAKFTLKDPGGEALAECTTVPAWGGGNQGSVTCTFTAEAAKRTHVAGSISLRTATVAATNSTKLTFTVGDTVTYEPDLPGGKPIVGPPANPRDPVTDPYKYGYQRQDVPSIIVWDVVVAPSKIGLGVGDPVVMKDEGTPGLTFTNPLNISLAVWPNSAAWESRQEPTYLSLQEGEHSFRFNGADHPYKLTLVEGSTAFTLEFSVWDPDAILRLGYSTLVPAGTGVKEFSNSVELNSQRLTGKAGYRPRIEGNLNGPGEGGFQVTKTLTGDADKVPSTAQFRVIAEWQATGPNGETIDKREVLLVGPGQTVGVNQLPMGTKVKITEDTSVEIEGADSYVPTFSSSDPGTQLGTDGGSIEITIGDQTIISVSLSNEITPPAETPPPTTTTPPPPTTTTPTTPPTPTAPQSSVTAETTKPVPPPTTSETTPTPTQPTDTGGENPQPKLPQTGADISVGLAALAIAATIGGLALILRRRK